jgi:hypothetical protein
VYPGLPARECPNTAAVAPHLYGSLEEQFAYGLDRLLDGLGIAGNLPNIPANPGQRRSEAAQGEGARSERQ